MSVMASAIGSYGTMLAAKGRMASDGRLDAVATTFLYPAALSTCQSVFD